MSAALIGRCAQASRTSARRASWCARKARRAFASGVREAVLERVGASEVDHAENDENENDGRQAKLDDQSTLIAVQPGAR